MDCGIIMSKTVLLFLSLMFWFFLIIVVLFAAEVVALVFGIIYQGKTNGELEKPMNDVIAKYDGQNPESITVDAFQSKFQCCGVTNYTSWSNTTWFTKNNNTVPLSCCKNASTECTGRLDQPNLLYGQGCKPQVQHLIRALEYALLVILGFAIFKFFGMLSICVITCRCNSKRSGYQPLYA
ncbi:tetraspanin 36 isoform X2 [Channa argus]|uniref:tetraspanin 36 isoform X2 n=1 Tax=Channa argus TaxID=215402 RepID=UPI003520AD29